MAGGGVTSGKGRDLNRATAERIRWSSPWPSPWPTWVLLQGLGMTESLQETKSIPPGDDVVLGGESIQLTLPRVVLQTLAWFGQHASVQFYFVF